MRLNEQPMVNVVDVDTATRAMSHLESNLDDVKRMNGDVIQTLQLVPEKLAQMTSMKDMIDP